MKNQVEHEKEEEEEEGGGESGCKLFFTVGRSYLTVALDSRVGEKMAME